MVAKKLFETNGDALNQVVTVGNNDCRVIGVYKNKDTAIGAYGEIGTALVANTQLSAENNTDAIGQIFSMWPMWNIAVALLRMLLNAWPSCPKMTMENIRQQIWVRL